MSVNQNYAGGVLREQWDDSTRKYTSWDENGVQTSQRTYTTQENTDADARARSESAIVSLEKQVAALEAYVFKASPPSSTAVPWTATDWPPASVVSYGGKTYKNNTSSWLNALCVPGDALHPFWTEQGATGTPWVTGMSLATGQYVSNVGHVYQWAQAPVASAPANYAPTGTVSTASWTFIS